jgi:hypothetical protein
MELTVLAVPGCPNAPMLERRLAMVLAGRPAVTITRQVITDAAMATEWGMQARGFGLCFREQSERFDNPIAGMSGRDAVVVGAVDRRRSGPAGTYGRGRRPGHGPGLDECPLPCRSR